MAGKNHLMRWMRLYAGGYDLSGDARTFDALLNNYEDVDLTGWGDAAKNYVAGGGRATGLQRFQALMNDTVARAFAVLKEPDQQIPVSILFGGAAEPTYADPAYLLGAVQMSAPMGWDGGAAALTADFMPDAREADTNSGNPWGVVLYPATSIAVTTSGTVVDNLAESTIGAHANLHITATASGIWSLLIQASTTGAFGGEETTLLTFTPNGSTVTAEHISVAGTIPRYTRFRAVRTSGTTTFLATLARN